MNILPQLKQFTQGDLVKISPDNEFAKMVLLHNVSISEMGSLLRSHFSYSKEDSEAVNFIIRMLQVVKNNEIGMVTRFYKDMDKNFYCDVLFPSGLLRLKSSALFLMARSRSQSTNG